MTIKVVLSFCILGLCIMSNAYVQAHNIFSLLRSHRSDSAPVEDTWAIPDGTEEYSPVYIAPQDGLAQLDKIDALPGQPEGVDFDQYSGYVRVDPSPTDSKDLFYYFVESPKNSSTNPLVLWLNGGRGCSALTGALQQQGPFRVNAVGKTLLRNKHAWNNVANVIFLESPAGVGFSYSNSSSVYNTTGDRSTALDAYTFLVNWLERFPQYKHRDFYIAGESYAGHYVPQLGYTVLLNNKKANQTIINLKGIALGNALIDEPTALKGIFDFLWSHGLNSDETHEGIYKYCNFVNDSSTGKCDSFFVKSNEEPGNINIYNIYAPNCLDPRLSNGSSGSLGSYDPCWESYVKSYLNTAELQKAFHVKPTAWDTCSTDPDSILPTASLRYSIKAMKLPVQTAFRAWYLDKEVAGYVEEYEGVTLITVRVGGHPFPRFEPDCALTMFSSFLQGILPPSE